MWDAYIKTVMKSPMDWGILSLGVLLITAHLVGLIGHIQGRKVLFVQDLDRYRTACLLVTELLPMLGLLGTVLGLMSVFKTFQVAAGSEAPDISHAVQAFAPAMSTTISGLLMSIVNLALNAVLWAFCTKVWKGHSQL